ncbi:hypothetical protein O6H91_22G041700 [Diphasiastrum complanatum]|uniref:Uncharacterized protein n=2 Tax=Diphasiastrum complanatum TaxID=34168 RepID=A0ACC2AES4_DIPCM|nr:hypothetical protein O6H91_Y019600 [Diphasiastrum complanatum]KAJ7300284.1 hypothetical protein O6H91_Y019700 [Diphasiastrum complanatum]KAJ7516071.1 hypothetical protein O6H91_22G041600 [Diphasiastrum complanatum]KAJ7516072.1 hypothetical protein O6H91_22G041700 [Diphasiastrum complanatum]
MEADSSSAAVRALHMYYAENEDRSQKNQHGSLAKLVQCVSEAYSMLFAMLFLFCFVGAGVAMASFAESCVLFRDLDHLSELKPRNDKEDKTIKPSLQNAKPTITANANDQ